MPRVLMHKGRNECSQPLESSFFFSLVLLLAQSSLRQGERDREGIECVWWYVGAESTQDQVHGPIESERAKPPVPKPYTPPTAQAKTMGACAQPPGCRGMARHQVALLQLCQPPPPPWDHACLAAQLIMSSLTPETSCPREFQPAPTRSQRPPSLGAG